jgi:putative transposase
MPRIARGLADNNIYHILNRGNNKQNIFCKHQDYEAFTVLIKEAKKLYPVKLFAYCLMPNHFHMIATPSQAKDLSKWMQWLMTSHVRRYNKHYNAVGHVWQGRFKSFIIQNNEYLINAIRYVETNPVRAGLVNTANDWPWSSHKETIGERNRFLIDFAPIELPANWREYVDAPIAEKILREIRKSIERRSPYGTLEWQIQICEQLGLESTLRPRGRPRKHNKLACPLYPFSYVQLTPFSE